MHYEMICPENSGIWVFHLIKTPHKPPFKTCHPFRTPKKNPICSDPIVNCPLSTWWSTWSPSVSAWHQAWQDFKTCLESITKAFNPKGGWGWLGWNAWNDMKHYEPSLVSWFNHSSEKPGHWKMDKNNPERIFGDWHFDIFWWWIGAHSRWLSNQLWTSSQFWAGQRNWALTWEFQGAVAWTILVSVKNK